MDNMDRMLTKIIFDTNSFRTAQNKVESLKPENLMLCKYVLNHIKSVLLHTLFLSTKANFWLKVFPNVL